MKIALVAPPWFTVPPRKYGGIEYVVGILADGLVDKGHSVTVFTVESSQTKARKWWIFEDERIGTLKKEPTPFLTEAIIHALGSYMEIESEGDYDVINDHTWKEGLLSAYFLKMNVIHTIHSPMDAENRKFYSLFVGSDRVKFIAVSEWQREALQGLNYLGTIYNAIPVEDYPYCENKEDFFLYIGKFNEDKAPHIACKVASELGIKLILAGKIHTIHEKHYFDKKIKPYLSDKIIYEGEVSDERKKELLCKAKALLFPIQWEEPFGLPIIEAMACGTPVVSFSRGAAPEIILDGKTGFLAKNYKEFVDKVKRVEEIDPRDCRRRVEEKFSKEVMVSNYERAYKRSME